MGGESILVSECLNTGPSPARWSRPIRPTLAAGVWQGSEARRAGARPGMHTKAGGKERCLRHSARASTYGQAVLRTQSNLINARPARARSHYYMCPPTQNATSLLHHENLSQSLGVEGGAHPKASKMRLRSRSRGSTSQFKGARGLGGGFE